MSDSEDSEASPFAKAAKRLRTGGKLSDPTLSRKIQFALEQPENESAKDMQLSGETIGKLMGRKSISGCH